MAAVAAALQQPGDRRLLSTAPIGREAGQTGADCLHALARGHAHAMLRQYCLETSLTPNTVVHEQLSRHADRGGGPCDTRHGLMLARLDFRNGASFGRSFLQE